MAKIHSHLKGIKLDTNEFTSLEYGIHQELIEKEIILDFSHRSENEVISSQFNELVTINVPISASGVIFKGCVFLKKVSVNSLEWFINFADCFFADSIELNYSNSSEFINVIAKSNAKKIEVNGDGIKVKVSNSKVGNISCQEGSIDDLNVEENSAIGVIDSTIVSDLEFKNSSLATSIMVGHIKNRFILNQVNQGVGYRPSIEISKSVALFTLQKVSVGSVILKMPQNAITIENSTITNVLEVSNSPNVGSLKITNSDLFDVLINSISLRNQSFFKMSNSRLGNSLKILESNLSSASFKLVQLRSASVDLLDVNLDDWDFEQVDWPKGHKIQLSDSDKVISSSIQTRDFFRILKQKSLSKGDEINANYFKANELEQHFKLVSEESKLVISEKGFINYLRNNLFSEWFILWTNKLFSGYGGNVWRPLLIGLLVFHLFFFNVFVIASGIYEFEPFYMHIQGVSLNASFNGLVEFLTLFNPVHKFKDEVTLNALSKIVDLAMRVSSGYFIFYILRASRKFSK